MCTFKPAIDKKSAKMVERMYGPAVIRRLEPNVVGNPSLISAYDKKPSYENHDLAVEDKPEPQRGYAALYALHKEKLAKIE